LVAKAAEDVMARSAKLNDHTPLVPESLPGVQGNALAGSKFARYYQAMFPPQVPQGTVNTPPPPAPAKLPAQGPTLMEILNAGIPPSNYEMEAKRGEKQKQIENDNTTYVNGQPANLDQVKAMIDTAFRTLADEMRTE